MLVSWSSVKLWKVSQSSLHWIALNQQTELDAGWASTKANVLASQEGETFTTPAQVQARLQMYVACPALF